MAVIRVQDIVVLGFADATGARLAYDEVLDLADNADLEALALRPAGPAGHVRVELPDQLSAGNTTTDRDATLLHAVLDAEPTAHARQDGRTTDLASTLRDTLAVGVSATSSIARQRFTVTMSAFTGVTSSLPARL